jgi:hypothetical protein
MRSLPLLLVLVGCADPEHYPGGPGGPGGGGGGGGGDAVDGGGGDGGEGDVTIHVCRMVDLRGVCDAWDGTELDLRIGSGSPRTITGEFTMSAPIGSPVIITLDDPTGVYFGSAVEVAENDVGLTMGVIANADLDEVLIASSINPAPGTGVTALHVDDPGGAPAPGVILDAARGSDAWYATDSAGVFVPEGPTDSSGTAVYFDLAAGDFTADANRDGISYLISGYAVADALVNLNVQLIE